MENPNFDFKKIHLSSPPLNRVVRLVITTFPTIFASRDKITTRFQIENIYLPYSMINYMISSNVNITSIEFGINDMCHRHNR